MAFPGTERSEQYLAADELLKAAILNTATLNEELPDGNRCDIRNYYFNLAMQSLIQSHGEQFASLLTMEDVVSILFNLDLVDEDM